MSLQLWPSLYAGHVLLFDTAVWQRSDCTGFRDSPLILSPQLRLSKKKEIVLKAYHELRLMQPNNVKRERRGGSGGMIPLKAFDRNSALGTRETDMCGRGVKESFLISLSLSLSPPQRISR